MAEKLALSLLIGGKVDKTLITSADKARDALNNLNAGVKKLEQTSRQISGVDNLKSSLAETREAYKKAQSEVVRLSDAISQTESPTRKQTAEFNRAVRAASKLRKQYSSNASSLRNLQAQLEKTGVNTKNLSAAQADLRAKLVKTKAAQERLAAATGARQANRDAINGLYAQGAETLALGYVMTRIIGPAVRLESAMADVAKVVEFESAQAMSLFEDRLKSMSREIPIATTGLAAIAAEGGRLGVSVESLPDFVSVVSKMATAFDLLPEEAGQAIAKLSNVFNIPINDIEKLGDAINQLANNTAATEAGIVEVLTRIGGSTKQFGLSATQAASLADAFLALGKPPQVAATAINALTNKLLTAEAQGAKFQDGLASIGLNAESLAASIRSNPQQALLDFLSTLEKLDKQSRAVVLTNLFGQEYSDDISLLTGSLETYRKALGLVANETDYLGGINAEFGKRVDTTEAQLVLLSNAANEVAANFGKALLPILKTVVDGLRAVLGAVADFVNFMPEISAVVGTAVAGFIALKLSSIALRLTWLLLKQPGLALGEILATVGARSATATAGIAATGTASTATAGAVGLFRIALVALEAALKRLPFYVFAAGTLAVADALNKSSEAMKEQRKNTESYRSALKKTADENERYAGTQVKTAKELAAMSDREVKAYDERIEKAEKYWRARALLESDFTGTADRETMRRKELLLQGMRDLREHLGDRDAAYKQHAKSVNDAKTAETAAIKKAFDEQKAIYDKEISQLNKIKSARESFNQSIKDLNAAPSQPGDDLIKDTVLAPIKELQRGQSSIAAGDFEAAEASAKRTVEQLNALKEAGKISSSFLSSLSGQASEIGNSAFDGLKKQQEESINAVKQKMQELKNDAEFLRSIHIGFDAESALQSAEEIRAQIQAKLAENPVVIPVSAAAGDVPNLDDVPARAMGGPIFGNGPKGKDSVLTWMAPNEHVITSREVDAAGGHSMIYKLRRALLSGWTLPSFESGGALSRLQMPTINIPQPAMAGASDGRPLLLDLNGKQYAATISQDQGDALTKAIIREKNRRGRK